PDQRRFAVLVALELGELGALGAAAAARDAADHDQFVGDEGADQVRLLVDRVGGAADQRTEHLKADAGVAMLEIRRVPLIVLEAAIGQERATGGRRQAELAVEQEVAAVEAHVGGAVGQRHAVLAVVAEDAAEGVHRRQDAAVGPVAEQRAVAPVVAEITVEDLALEDIADHPATVAAAALDDDVAQAGIIEIAALDIAVHVETMALAAPALDRQALDQEVADDGAADHVDDVAAVGDVRDQPRAIGGNAGKARDIGPRLALEGDPEGARHPVVAGRND